MFGRICRLTATVLVLSHAATICIADDILVEETTRRDVAVAAALDARFDDAANTVAEISRLDVRDATYYRIAVIAARKAEADQAVAVSARFSDRIANAGVGNDAAMEVAIALARRGNLDVAESMASRLDPQRRDGVRAVIAMVMAEQTKFRDAWLTARRTSDLGRRRDSLITMRGGLGKSLTARAAIGAALGADTQQGRVRSLMAVARGLVARGEPGGALLALSRVPAELQKGFVDSNLVQEATADRAMILISTGDVGGALLAAKAVRSRTLQQFILRQIEETRKFPIGK